VSEAAPPDEPGEGRTDGDEPRRVAVTRRSAPKYRAFGLTGLLAGVAAGVAVALGFDRPENAEYTERAIAGYFGTGLGLIGLLLGLAVALLVERRRR
jgi:hypothetical protein